MGRSKKKRQKFKGLEELKLKNEYQKALIDQSKMDEELQRIKLRTGLMKQRENAVSRITNSGYSHGGASTRSSWAKSYHSESLSPRRDIEENRRLLRERSRDLAMNTPIAAGAVNTTRTNCIGSGLVPKPKIDYEFLGMPREEAVKLQSKIKKEFALWAESTLCDNNDQNNFYELQQIALSDWLKNGEAFALVRYGDEDRNMPYQLRLRLISADRVCTENSYNGEYDTDVMLKNKHRVMNGLELDASGKVVAYYICSGFPGEYNETIFEWDRIEKRGKRTGNLNVLHIFNAERSEQYRGVPFLAPVIQSIKQLTRYTEAEIMAAVVNSILALFVTTETGDDVGGYGGEDEGGTYDDADNEEIRIGAGTVHYLKNGENIKAVESTHPSGNFDAFMNAITVQIGSALEIAPEVLLKKFSNNYSASKGAMNETWKAFLMRRKWFVNDFCQTVYDLWFAEAVSKGRIHAPGFFTDPLIRKAYTNATWNGPAQGSMDPVRDVNAAATRIANGLSTHEDECAAMNGSDFEDNVRTLGNENEQLADAVPVLTGADTREDEGADEEDEDEED